MVGEETDVCLEMAHVAGCPDNEVFSQFMNSALLMLSGCAKYTEKIVMFVFLDCLTLEFPLTYFENSTTHGFKA